MDVRTTVVIVMYNQCCADAVTCDAIAANTVQPDAVFVVDNSTRDMGNEAYCRQRGWDYLSMNGNAGLSKAYNAAVAQLKGMTDMIVWADDDTLFPNDYFEKLGVYAQRFPDSDLFIPVVKSASVLLSPAVYTQRIVYPVQSLDELKNCQITAINSGLAVRMDVYDTFSYDEAIFLDYVDHDFLRWCRENNKKLCIMEDVLLKQNFFAESIPSRSARKHRMSIYVKDIRIFEAKCGKSPLMTEWDLLKYRYFQWRNLRQRITKAKQDSKSNEEFSTTEDS